MSSLMLDGHFSCCPFILLVLTDFELFEALSQGVALLGQVTVPLGMGSIPAEQVLHLQPG